MTELVNRGAPTHVCVDCGALGYAGGYHDHGGGNAGETIALKDLPGAIRALQAFESEVYELREALEREAGRDT